MNVFVSPSYPRLRIDSEADLDTAVREGLVTENHFLDVKRVLPDPDKNDGLAKDLAAFSTDGGTILVGIDEPVAGHFVLDPQVVAGQRERLDQIARMRVDPAVSIEVEVIDSLANPGKGYLVVRIPPSPSAPHMVTASGVYMGRGDSTNRSFTDIEVRRLHDRREPVDDLANRIFDEMFARYSAPDGQGHLMLFARPVSGHRKLRARQIEDARYGQWTYDLYAGALEVLQCDFDVHPADLARAEAMRDERRPNGVAFVEGLNSSHPTSDLEIRMDGEIRYYNAEIAVPLKSGPNVPNSVQTGSLSASVWLMIELCHAIGDATGYTGNWLVGSATTGMTEATGVNEHYSLPSDGWREHIEATNVQLDKQRQYIANELIGSALRILGFQGDREKLGAPDA